MTYLTLKQQEMIKQVTAQIVAMIKEEGIEEFEKRILLALRKHLTEEDMKCDNTNK